ncbi:hypothetical protein AAHE18_05G287600 [Arachis hypogaea]
MSCSFILLARSVSVSLCAAHEDCRVNNCPPLEEMNLIQMPQSQSQEQ